jgi:hypothetical protein
MIKTVYLLAAISIVMAIVTKGEDYGFGLWFMYGVYKMIRWLYD